VDDKDIIYFAKVKEGAIIPSRREEDGCYDLYSCFEEESLIILPHTVKLIPTGIASAFSSKYRIAFRERGSNTKPNLKVSAGQIDSGYRGEYFVALHNDNDIPVEITKTIDEFVRHEDYMKFPYSKAICQFAIEEVPQVSIQEISYEELKEFKSERGMGKLGSSKK
jgi:dUTP pyrophosphatase